MTFGKARISIGSEQRLKAARNTIGVGAVALALYFLATRGHEPVILFASLFLLTISVTDTMHGKIPNLAPLTMLIVSIGYHLDAGGFPAAAIALAGLITGLILLIVPYLLGGVGAGDVKALASLGALLGPAAIFQVFIFAGLIGGGMALLNLSLSRDPIARLRSWQGACQRLLGRTPPAISAGTLSGERFSYPYGPAIAFGFYAFINWGAMA